MIPRTLAIICLLLPFSGAQAEIAPVGAETPVVQSADYLEVVLGERVHYEIEASQAPLAYSVQGAPFWLKREGNVLKGTALSLGSHELILSASNLHGKSAPYRLMLKVVAPNKNKP
jgi:hypothetical protein